MWGEALLVWAELTDLFNLEVEAFVGFFELLDGCLLIVNVQVHFGYSVGDKAVL